jgi:AAA domain
MSSYEATPGISFTDVQEHQLDWLWDKRILRGKLTLLDGDPDLGKSLITLDLAARVTTGQPMPDGSPGIKGNVILIAPEDDVSDTIKPRILAADGDPSRIRMLTIIERPDPRTDQPHFSHFTLPTHLPTLMQSIQRTEAVLVIIDPLVSVLDRTISVSNDQQMRNVLIRLANLAQYTNCAILLVRHLTKGSLNNPLYRGSGSVGIIASARSSLLVVRDPSDEQKRILIVTKNNLSTKAPDLSYHITSNPDGLPTIHWLGISSTPLLSQFKNTPELSAGRQAILNVLRDSDVPLGPKEIAEHTGQKYEQVKVVLRRMFNAQELISPSYGLYTVHGRPSSSTTSPYEETTPATPDTLEIVNHFSSNSSDTSDTSATPATPATVETQSLSDAGFHDTPATPATLATLETVRPSNTALSDTSDTPATPDTLATLELVSDHNSHISDTLVTLEPVSDPDSHVSDTPETLETLETLETVEEPGQTPSIDLDAIIKKIRTLFSCSHDIHYLQWHIFVHKIGCPICDNWLVRDSIYNPTILALYEILNHNPPLENEHRRTWLERITPFIP